MAVGRTRRSDDVTQAILDGEIWRRPARQPCGWPRATLQVGGTAEQPTFLCPLGPGAVAA